MTPGRCAAVLLLALAAHADMGVDADATARRFTITDGGRPVLTYHFGTNPVPPGVSGLYAVARGDYVHPLFGPAGEILTTDFAKDHPHHRGLYWAWPLVGHGNATNDLHALQGVFARPVGAVAATTGATSATLVATNDWLWQDREAIVRETATITAHRAGDGLQPIDFVFRFEALKPGVTLARRHGDAYGGFNLRLSSRDAQQIDKSAAAWAELAGIPPAGREPVGVLILQAPSNPFFPGDWIDYANLNWLQPTFPAKHATHVLRPGEPLELRYRIVIRSGAGLKADPAKLHAAYAATCPDPLARMTAWRETQSRAALTAIETELRGATPDQRRQIGRRLATALTNAAASGDFKRWALHRLTEIEGDAAVPVAAALLRDHDAWMQAADLLASRTGEAGPAALREALPGLPADRQPAILNLLAIRRDACSVSLAVSLTGSAATGVASSAFALLGAVADEAAVKALLDAAPRPEAIDALAAAQLQAAEARLAAGDARSAKALYEQRAKLPGLPAWQHAAGLRVLAALDPASALPSIRAGLLDRDRDVREAAAAALPALSDDAIAGLRDAWAGSSDPVRLILIRTWGDRGTRSAEPQLLEALAAESPAIAAESAHALVRAGTAAAVGPLLQRAARTDEPGRAALAALARLPASGVDAALRAHLDNTSAPVAVAALKSLSARRAPGHADDLVRALSSGRRELARVAATALRTSGEAAQLPALRALLVTTTNDTQPEIAQILVAICKRQPDPQTALRGVLETSPTLQDETRRAMLAALPAIGGPVALAFASKSTDEAAIRALLNWPDAAALDPLVNVAGASNQAAVRDLAVAGYIQLAERVVPAAQRPGALARVLPFVTNAAERERIAELVERNNLALGAAATSSRPSEAGHPPVHAVDGRRTLDSYWGCTPPPAALTLDLGATQRIGRVNVCTYWDGQRAYQYLVEASADGQGWSTVADQRTNTVVATPAGLTHRFDPVAARFLRVTMTGNTANPGLHIVELEAYAPAAGAGGVR